MNWLARYSRSAEAACGTLGIAVLGVVNIPLAGAMFGAHISTTQAAGMTVYFAACRFVWLYALRVWFSRRAGGAA